MSQVKSRVTGLMVVALCGVFTPCVLAQQPEPSPAVEAPAEPAAISDSQRPAATNGLSIRFTPYGERMFAADLDDSAGTVSIWRAGGILTFQGELGQRAGWGFTAGLEHSYYDLNNAFEFAPAPPAESPTGSLFNDVWTLDLVPSLQYLIDDRWSVRGAFLLELAGEPGVEVGDAITYGGAVAARYRFSDSLSLGFGLSGKTRLEDDPIIIPILSVSWRINERLSLTSESPRGPGVVLRAQATDQLAVLFSGTFEFRDYRLDEASPLPEGVVSDERVKVGVGIEWRPTPALSVTLEGGAAVWQRFEIYDRDGDEVTDRNADPAAFIALSGTIAW